MTLLKQLTKSAQFSSKLFNQQTLRSLSTTAGTQPDVAAFIARLKLNKLNPALVNNILERGEHIDHQKNGQLKHLGLQALDLFVIEKYMMEYPRLNRKFLEQILDLNFSQLQNSKLVQSFGFDKLLTQTVSDPADLKFKASKSFLSLIGAIYEQQGALEAREFIENYVTPRNLKIEEVLEFEPAKVVLSQFVQKMGKEQPVTRLLKESGRLSNRPIFIVGVFSGTEKLSEGYGSSLKMAEYRACKNYLVNFHSKKRIDFELPSNAQDKSSTYKPSELEPTPLVL